MRYEGNADIKIFKELSSLLVICVSLFWAYCHLSPLLVYCVVALQLRLLLMHGSRVCSTVNTLLGRIILIVNEQQNAPNAAALWFFSGTSAAFVTRFSLLSTHNLGFSSVVVWKNILPACVCPSVFNSCILKHMNMHWCIFLLPLLTLGQ